MNKLEEMLKYVSEHNDFYKKRIAEYETKRSSRYHAMASSHEKGVAGEQI